MELKTDLSFYAIYQSQTDYIKKILEDTWIYTLVIDWIDADWLKLSLQLIARKGVLSRLNDGRNPANVTREKSAGRLNYNILIKNHKGKVTLAISQ